MRGLHGNRPARQRRKHPAPRADVQQPIGAEQPRTTQLRAGDEAWVQHSRLARTWLLAGIAGADRPLVCGCGWAGGVAVGGVPSPIPPPAHYSKVHLKGAGLGDDEAKAADNKVP